MKITLAFLLFLYCLTPCVNIDMNHDGKFTITDLVRMRVFGEVADANLNGIANEQDIDFLRHYLAYK